MKTKLYAALVAALAVTASAGEALLAPSQAMATTYTYVGSPYIANTRPEELGTNMTGSVTFNFDTSGVSGTFQGSDGVITDLRLTSGIYTTTQFYPIPGHPNPYFVLSAGEIILWSVDTAIAGCPGSGVSCQMYSIKLDPIPPFSIYGDAFVEVSKFATRFASGESGKWSMVPGPIAGAGLPGLLLAALGLFGWRRRASAPKA